MEVEVRGSEVLVRATVITLYSAIERIDSLRYVDSAEPAALTEQKRTMEPVQTGNSAIDIALNKAEIARHAALSAPGLTPAQATAGSRRWVGRN